MSRAAGLDLLTPACISHSRGGESSCTSSAAVQSAASSRLLSFFGCLSSRGDKYSHLKWNKDGPRRRRLVEALVCEGPETDVLYRGTMLWTSLHVLPNISG